MALSEDEGSNSGGERRAVDPRRSLPVLRQAWGDLPELKLNARRMAHNRIVSAMRQDPDHAAIDMLRTRLMDSIRTQGWQTLGITSPTRRCGKTTLAVNLALSFTHQADFRVGLLDFDLRRPSIARMLGVEQPADIEAFLRGYREMTKSLVRYRHNLVVAPNGIAVPGAAELLIEAMRSPVLAQMQQAFDLDLLIFDLPPMLTTDDAIAILPMTDAMLLVAAAGESQLGDIDMCERELSHHDKFAGLVLTKCRYMPNDYGYRT